MSRAGLTPQTVPDDAYDATTWNGSTEVPTKNAIRDKIESMGGGNVVGAASSTDNGLVIYDGTSGKLLKSIGTVYTDLVTLNGSNILTNKNLTSGTNTFPTFNQSTTGSAATLTTSRNIQTDLSSTSAAAFNGSAAITPGVTGTLAVANGGTGAVTHTSGNILTGSGTSPISSISTSTLKSNMSLSNVDNTSDVTKNAASVALTNKDLTSSTNTYPNGMALQTVTSTYTAVATGTTILPLDDSIPQITEGTEFMTVTITPKYATSLLVVEAVSMIANTIVTNVSVALFRDSTANALAASTLTIPGNSFNLPLPLSHSVTSGSTSATTFRIRMGPSAASTMTFNGIAGSRFFGAISKSFMIVTEYKA